MKFFNPTFYLFCFTFAFITVNCQSCKNKENNNEITSIIKKGNKPFLKVSKELNFGKIDKIKTPKKVIYIDIINTGNAPLVIIKTDVTCGCLKTNFTKYPILKGKKGLIKVEINTKSQIGFINKPIIIISNAQNHTEIIRVKGFIQ